MPSYQPHQDMDRKPRKQPSRNEDTPMVTAAKEEVLPGYEEYLVLLQERNRLLKRLRKKNKSEIDIERKEQGFSLYVNGPHKDGKAAGKTPGNIPTQPRTARKPKTAGDARHPAVLDNRALEVIAHEQMERQREIDRAKTAPSARERRRNWNVESVEIKTTKGNKRVKAPDILTGRYTDDFEADEDSDEYRSSASENSDDESTQSKQTKKPLQKKPPPPRESDMFNSSDSINSDEEQMEVSRHMSSVLEGSTDEDDMEIDAAQFSKPPNNASPKKRDRRRGPPSEEVSDDDEGSSEKLMLSMKELQKLRQSLVKNATIRESMAKGIHSVDDDDFMRDSTIQEVEEDIPTDESFSPEDSPKKIDLSQANKKNDTIVLEFGGGPLPGKKVQKNLSVARRKDLDDEDYSMAGGRRPLSGQSSRGSGTPNSKPQSTKVLGSESASKKSARPLSASRRTPEAGSLDTNAEAREVMAALRAENEKAKQFKGDKPSTPAKRPLPNAPAYDKSERPPKTHQMKPSDSGQRDSRGSLPEPMVPPDKIGQIMDRVLKMTPQHQRRLVKMLGKIEQSLLVDSVDTDAKTARNSKQPQASPVKATRSSVEKSKPRGGPPAASDVVKVDVVIKSNWGHNMRLGLTEIQLYDNNNALVFVAPSDVSVHRAEDCKGTVDLLVNGKFKTNKERNMWSCRYHARRPVEISLNARPSAKQDKGESFSLSQMKIWNYNKSLQELDMGVKDVEVYVNGDHVFSGSVEKGCGNQVFDYGHVISLVPSPTQTDSSQEIEERDSVERVQKVEPKVYYKSRESVSKSQISENNRNAPQAASRKKLVQKATSSSDVSKSSSKENGSAPERSEGHGRVPISPRARQSASPSPRFNSSASPRSSRSNNHRSISPSLNQEKKKSLRSISMTDQSSSGGESQPNSRPGSGVVKSTDREKPVRIETRTLNHPTLSLTGSDSQSENEEYVKDGPSKGSTPAKRRGVRTPRKSKRMAARLDGLTSTDVESSRSVTDSSEQRPPLPSRKSDEKVHRKSLVEKSLDDKHRKPEANHGVQKNVDTRSEASRGTGKNAEFRSVVGKETSGARSGVESEADLDDTLKGAGHTVGSQISSSVSVTSSQDDMPMLQKLKDMNKKEQSTSRKKDVPHWLKQEDINSPFASPFESAEVQVSRPMKQEMPPVAPPTPDEIDSLIDEELASIGQKKPPQAAQRDQPETDNNFNSTADEATPFQKIQQSRSRRREDLSMNLEESWQSLSQFNQRHHGRLSLDMDGDVLDEYINKAAKMVGLPPVEPAILEEADTAETQGHSNTSYDDESFLIPELPYGRELVINIKTTWGDKHYVGFTGIEVFSSSGEQVHITKVRANPSDINILDGYKNDPRVVKNLIDGVNRTRDDVHMWLAPFTAGSDHLVYATFDKPCKVALIRIWNYNKSRIHSYRGAKEVVINLDSTVIFRGEIARACGGVEGGTEAFGDTILFTMDEAILEAVSQNDEAYEGEMLSDDEPFDIERPSTADAGEAGDRPFTRAVGNVKQLERERTAVSPVPEYQGDIMVFKGQNITMNFTATWGDHHYLGLTGLEIVGPDGEALPVTLDRLTASPRDVRHLQGHERDDRTLDKVIDGTNVTTSDEHMWLVPFTEGQSHTLSIDFDQKVLMAGLRLWNYNKSKEDTYRGARMVHVAIDGKIISPPDGYLVRKGPGNCHFDYAQEISFAPDTSAKQGAFSPAGHGSGIDDSQNYEVVQMPCGFIYQLQLFSTWGDPYYVGLNGVEFYDANLQKIKLTETNISAYPDSVNVLEKIQNDVRTPDKLIDGLNDTMDGGHMWLAPILPGALNRVYVIFDQPTSVSMIKVWNYSKTPNRGAKDFALLVDDLLVYNGTLNAVQQTRGILPTCEGPQQYHTIAFVNNKDILRKEKHTLLNNQTGEQDVQMTNDKKIMSHYNDPKQKHAGKAVDQSLRPTTGVVHHHKKRR